MAEWTVARALSEWAGDLERVGDEDRRRAARDGEIGLLLRKSSSAESSIPASTTSMSPPGDPSSLDVVSASCFTAWVISRRVLWRISASSLMAARLASLWFSHSSDCFAKPLSWNWNMKKSLLLWLRLLLPLPHGLSELSISKGQRHFAYSQQIKDVIKGNKNTVIHACRAFHKELLTECSVVISQKIFFTGSDANTGFIEHL